MDLRALIRMTLCDCDRGHVCWDPEFCPCESGGDGGDPGLLAGWTVGTGVSLKSFRK